MNDETSPIKRALGLMSGTSMDAIDIALIESDGETHVQRGPAASFPYSTQMRQQLQLALDEARHIGVREDRPGRLSLLETYLTDLHAEAVGYFLADHDIEPDSIDVVGFHGQTVLHHPEKHLTVQIGDGTALAAAIGIDVVHDMRAADCASGGVGAPLAPAYHRAVLHKLPAAAAVLNIGGVANVTWLAGGGAHEDLIAFDTGPGNALLDDWMMQKTGEPIDKDGATAAKGTARPEIVDTLLQNPYFSAAPPKALDRNAFDLTLIEPLSLADGAATLVAFSAQAIALAMVDMPEPPQLWVVTGGGRKNPTLMAAVSHAVASAVVPAEEVALDGDAMEAEAWAYLAIRSLRGLPLTFPGTTGVAQPTKGGVLSRA